MFIHTIKNRHSYAISLKTDLSVVLSDSRRLEKSHYKSINDAYKDLNDWIGYKRQNEYSNYRLKVCEKVYKNFTSLLNEMTVWMAKEKVAPNI